MRRINLYILLESPRGGPSNSFPFNVLGTIRLLTPFPDLSYVIGDCVAAMPSRSLSALIVSDESTQKEWVLVSDRPMQFMIGRSSRCSICLVAKETESISALHAMIEYDNQNNYWRLTDLGSKSGTFVNKTLQGYTRSLVGGEFERLDESDTILLGSVKRGRKLDINCLVWRMRQLHNSVRAIRMISDSEDPENLYCHSRTQTNRRQVHRLSWLPADCSKLIEPEFGVAENGQKDSSPIIMIENENLNKSKERGTGNVSPMPSTEMKTETIQRSSDQDKWTEQHKVEKLERLISLELRNMATKIDDASGDCSASLVKNSEAENDIMSDVTEWEFVEQHSIVERPQWDDDAYEDCSDYSAIQRVRT